MGSERLMVQPSLPGHSFAFHKYLLTTYCVLGMFTLCWRRKTHQHALAVIAKCYRDKCSRERTRALLGDRWASVEHVGGDGFSGMGDFRD